MISPVEARSNLSRRPGPESDPDDPVELARLAGFAPAEVECVDEIPSTNTELLRRPLTATPQVRLLLARHQTAGRGRRGRVWTSGVEDSLTFSLSVERCLREDSPPLMGLSLALGVAVAQALTGLGVPGLALKWPNDVLRDGGKLAGMLLEVRSAGALERVVIGLGVNLHLSESLSASIDQPIRGAFDGLAQPPSRLQAAAALASALRARTQRFHREGFAGTGREWAACDFLAGAEVVVLDQGREVLSGRADGLGPGGELRVWQDDRLHLVAVGDVSVRRRPARPESA